jgi:hypothetical protein
VPIDRHVIAKGEYGGGLMMQGIKQKVHTMQARKRARIKQDNPFGHRAWHDGGPVGTHLPAKGIGHLARESRHDCRAQAGLKIEKPPQAIQESGVSLSVDLKQNNCVLFW